MAENDLPPPLTPDDVLLRGLHGDRPLPKPAPRAKAAAGDAAVQLDLTEEDKVPPHPSIVRELARDEAAGRRAPTLVVSRGGARWRWWLAGAALFGIGVLAAFVLARPVGPDTPAAPAAASPSHAIPKAATEATTTLAPATEATTETVHVAPTAPSGARSAPPRSAPPSPSGSPKQDSARVL